MSSQFVVAGPSGDRRKSKAESIVSEGIEVVVLYRAGGLEAVIALAVFIRLFVRLGLALGAASRQTTVLARLLGPLLFNFWTCRSEVRFRRIA